MATPPARLQRVKSGLYHALYRRRPRKVEVIEQLEVQLAEQLRRNPDVLVVRADDFDWQTARVPPSHVVLVIEVVSPGSQSEDRILKPRQYAQRHGLRSLVGSDDDRRLRSRPAGSGRGSCDPS